MTISIPGNVRIPNLPMGKIAQEDGMPTDDEQTFRQTLISSLQDNFGNEGCVVPSQPTTNITLIQNNTYIDQATGNTVYTCQGGTLIYDVTTNQLKVAILSGGVPTFHVVTVV